MLTDTDSFNKPDLIPLAYLISNPNSFLTIKEPLINAVFQEKQMCKPLIKLGLKYEIPN
jgi:hypothetical protein